jgi:thiol:disulfide interchange protein DsbD
MSAELRAEAVRDGAVEVQLVPRSQSVQPGRTEIVFLRMVHDAQWHSYWVSSSTGYPTTISLSANGAPLAASVTWPVPKVHEQGGIVDYVYEGTVAIPVSFTVPESLKPGDALHLSAEVNWLMCREECVPGHATLSLDLSVAAEKSKPDAEWLALLKDIREQIPTEAPGWTFTATREGRVIRLLVTMPEGTPSKPGTLYFFASDGSLVIEPSQPQKWIGDRQAELTLPLSRYAPENSATLAGVLSASDGFRFSPAVVGTSPDGSRDASAATLGQFPELWQSVPAVELSLPLHSRAASGTGLFGAILFGVLGGLVLNLMPCVFPILGIKVMSFAAQAGKGRRAILLHAAVFAGGVLAALWVLAGIVLILRGAGEAVGWGFQLQNPYVIYLGIVFFFLFGLNMLGVFEIGLGAGAVGGKWEGLAGLRGAFLSGLVAVIVATPCSAPFLGSAVGYAFTQGPFVFFAIFTAVGVGFSLPYFLLAAFPRLLAFLPKPGMWMLRLRQVLSLLLFATVAYLFWVLRAFGVGGGAIAGTLVFATLAAILYGRFSEPIRSRRAKFFGIGAAGLFLAIALALGWPRGTAGASADAALSETPVPAFVPGSDAPRFTKWSPGLPEKLAAQGRTVYVDFTARWCATCQVNKKLVFSSSEIREFFEKHGIVVLEADWTRRDPMITAELARHGRFAVPFNEIYAPGLEPVELPTVLTPGIVLDALRKLEEPQK